MHFAPKDRYPSSSPNKKDFPPPADGEGKLWPCRMSTHDFRTRGARHTQHYDKDMTLSAFRLVPHIEDVCSVVIHSVAIWKRWLSGIWWSDLFEQLINMFAYASEADNWWRATRRIFLLILMWVLLLESLKWFNVRRILIYTYTRVNWIKYDDLETVKLLDSSLHTIESLK